MPWDAKLYDNQKRRGFPKKDSRRIRCQKSR